MAKYLLTSPRYVRQKGQGLPGYVEASPTKPAEIELDDDAKLDSGLLTLDGEPAVKPKPLESWRQKAEPKKE